MNKDLLKLFDLVPLSEYDELKLQNYYRLKGSSFTYVYRESCRWIDYTGPRLYVSFEHVLDNVDEDTQIQLLFHLDYFLGEIKEEEDE